MSGSLGWPAAHAACRRLLGTEFAEATRLAGGPNSAVYRVTLPPRRQPSSVIVKLYARRAQWKAAREYQALTALTTAATAVAGVEAFAVPETLASGQIPGTDTAALILQDLGSLTLHAAVCGGVCSRSHALRTLGRLLAAFHQAARPPQVSGELITGSKGVDQVTTLPRHLPDELRTATSAALERATELIRERPRVWCHGDLHLDNVMLQPTGQDVRPCLIDFEETTLAVAEYDLAQTVVTADALAPEERSLIVAGYGPGVDTDLLNNLIVFQALRGWLSAAVRERRNTALWDARLKQTLGPYAALGSDLRQTTANAEGEA